jgi:polyferredoxin
MTHPGLPVVWCLGVLFSAAMIACWALVSSQPMNRQGSHLNLLNIPVFGRRFAGASGSPWLLFLLKLLVTGLFILVIVSGMYGTPIPARNLATVLTWNIWWAGLIVSVLFLGSAWCAVCPWDALATWLVKRRLWRRANPNGSMNIRVPRFLRNVWPALLLFIGLSWLELGLGVTTNPYTTALLALLMVVLATASLALFQRKAFCRYFCPVGRTIGFYAQLAPVELRPVNSDICASCTSLDCYYGNDLVEPCPTHLVMGSLQQNTYCTSCGNCIQSCPHGNVVWRLRPLSREAIQDARPHLDEAWFMLALLALALFHGVTMLPFWEAWVRSLAQFLGDSGQLLWSFSLAMVAMLILPVGIYAFSVSLVQRLQHGRTCFKTLFPGFAFVTLPLAFAYHLAHNLNHLLREGRGLGELLGNPLGTGLQPWSMAAKQARMMSPLISQDSIHAAQALLIVAGFWIAVQVIRHRGSKLVPEGGWRLSPMICFALLVTGFQLWLLAQPMLMRF